MLHVRNYYMLNFNLQKFRNNRSAQSVTCLATDVSLTADPVVMSLIRARSHTFVEIDHEIISTVILFPSANHSRKVVVSYKRKYVHEVLVNCLFKLAQDKSVIRWTDRPAMTIAVDLGCKATKQTNKKQFSNWHRNVPSINNHVVALNEMHQIL